MYDKDAGKLLGSTTSTSGKPYFDLPASVTLQTGRFYQVFIRGVNAAGEKGDYGRNSFRAQAAPNTVAAVDATIEQLADFGETDEVSVDFAHDELKVERDLYQRERLQQATAPATVGISQVAEVLASNDELLDVVLTDWHRTDWWEDDSVTPQAAVDEQIASGTVAAGIGAGLWIQQRSARTKRRRRYRK